LDTVAERPQPAVARHLVARAARRLSTLGLLSPPLLWLAAFFVVPVALVGAMSVNALALFPGEASHFSLLAWNTLFHGGVYLHLFWKSIRMSLVVSCVCVAAAYPIAYYLALCARRRKYVLLLLVVAPFWTSFLLRVLAWKVILGDQGLVNTFAYWAHLREQGHPIPQLLYSQFTVMVVLAYVWVPFVALPIFVSLESLDRHLLEAATDLGASRWQAFVRVTLPLSLPGVAAAFVFVFIPTIGEFVTPQLVGGTRGYMYGNQISDLFGEGFDWQTGSVLALFLLGVVVVLMIAFARFLQVRRVAT
jgi:spermidine/putrescine transport system permease protein